MPPDPQLPRKRSVAVAVRSDDDLVLAVRRPEEPGEELPGVWGLPAVTLRDGESADDGVRRVGREKLGIDLTPMRRLAAGEQRRESYLLEMTVCEASTHGEPSLPERAEGATTTLYDAFDWLPEAAFAAAADAGSLCCRLFVASARGHE